MVKGTIHTDGTPKWKNLNQDETHSKKNPQIDHEHYLFVHFYNYPSHCYIIPKFKKLSTVNHKKDNLTIVLPGSPINFSNPTVSFVRFRLG